MLETGFVVFLGVALILWKLPRRLLVRALNHTLAIDLFVTVEVPHNDMIHEQQRKGTDQAAGHAVVRSTGAGAEFCRSFQRSLERPVGRRAHSTPSRASRSDITTTGRAFSAHGFGLFASLL